MCRRVLNGSRSLLSGCCLLLLAAPLCAQPAYFTFHGDFPGDGLGSAVAVAGDVDNDGVLDILVGAPASDSRGVHSGLIRVFSGLDGSTLFTLEGEAAGDRLGLSVSGAGDVNADGFDDVIAGAPYDVVAGRDTAGSAWVCAGPAGNVLHVFSSPHRLRWLGTAVRGLGDVNGDGHSDLLIGVPGTSYGLYYSGAAEVYSGLDGSLLYAVTGDALGDRLGDSVGLAGDVDFDGVADFVVGAPQSDRNGSSSGMARIYSGAGGAILRSFDGDRPGDELGSSVSGAGDVNGDGVTDVIVGAPESNANGTRSGLAKVFSGRDGYTLHQFTGNQAFERVGWAIDAAGDRNADGYGDLVLGISASDINFRRAGAVRILSGLDGATLQVLHGSSEFAYFGSSVSDLPDIDGDGHADLLVGVPGDDFHGPSSGSARVYVERCGAITGIGSGCVGTGGYVPELAVTSSSECIAAGISLSIEVSRGLGGVGVPAGLLVSPGLGSTTLPNGCTLDVALPGSILIFLGYLSGFGDGNGTISLTTPPIPRTGTFYIQALIGDSFAGTVATNGFRFYLPE